MIHGGELDPATVGFVLAGGRSSRMGTDKALVEFSGKPLIAQAIATLQNAGLKTQIAGAHVDLSAFAPVIADNASDLGPLSGICSALASTSAERAVFLPVDMPLMPSQLIQVLVRHAQITGSLVTLASVNGFSQTFPAVISRAVHSALSAELGSGRSGCLAAFRAASQQSGNPIAILPLEHLIQSGQAVHPEQLPGVRWFQNVNTPSDLEHASALDRRPVA